MNGIMNCVGTSADAGSAAGKEPLRLDVLAVYEDFATGLRARQTLDQTVQRLEADADVQVNLWRFDLLREPALRQQAAEEAAEADIVFVSMHGQSELPEQRQLVVRGVVWTQKRRAVRVGGVTRRRRQRHIERDPDYGGAGRCGPARRCGRVSALGGGASGVEAGCRKHPGPHRNEGDRGGPGSASG